MSPTRRKKTARKKGAGTGGSANSLGAASLPKLRVRVLGDELVKELRAAIVEGAFPPGSRLVEAEIAEQMGVSRAPVREAIRALEREGLVEIFPHRGAVVVGVLEDEMRQIYELRALAEQIAFKQAVKNLTDEQLDELEELLDELEAEAARGRLDQMIEIDINFHRMVIQASGYRVILRLWDSLAGITRVRTLQALSRSETADYFLSHSSKFHRDLLEALRSRDEETVSTELGKHIIGVAERMREFSPSEEAAD